MTTILDLSSRRIFMIGGTDSHGFLQGLISQDIGLVEKNHALFSAFLTPQGKFRCDFFIMANPAAPNCLWIDCDGGVYEELMTALQRFILRRDVQITPQEHLAVKAVIDPDFSRLSSVGAVSDFGRKNIWESGAGFAYIDPRHPALGYRFIFDRNNPQSLSALGKYWPDFHAGTMRDYEKLRLELAIPEGTKDIIAGQNHLLEVNYDVLPAISWDKGCYMGQELTARVHYRGLVKKRLVGFTYQGDTPPSAQKIYQENTLLGETRSAQEGYGLALVKLQVLQPLLQKTDADQTMPPKPEEPVFSSHPLPLSWPGGACDIRFFVPQWLASHLRLGSENGPESGSENAPQS